MKTGGRLFLVALLSACATAPATRDLLTDGLLDSDDAARRAAVARLAGLDPAAKARNLAPLARAARGDDLPLRVRAIQAIGILCRAAMPRGGPEACGERASEAEIVDRMSAEALGAEAPQTKPDVTGTLLEALEKTDDAVADEVQAVFPKLGAPGPGLENDLALLLSSNRLAGLPPQAANETGREAPPPTDAVWTVRAGNAAGVALAQLRPDAAAPVFTRLLRSRSWFPRVVAAAALGTLGEPARPAVPALLEALSDENADVRDQALRSLRALRADSDEIDDAVGKSCGRLAGETLQAAADCSQASAMIRGPGDAGEETFRLQTAAVCLRMKRRTARLRRQCGDPGEKELEARCRERFSNRCDAILGLLTRSP